eukprot:UN30307
MMKELLNCLNGQMDINRRIDKFFDFLKAIVKRHQFIKHCLLEDLNLHACESDPNDVTWLSSMFAIHEFSGMGGQDSEDVCTYISQAGVEILKMIIEVCQQKHCVKPLTHLITIIMHAGGYDEFSFSPLIWQAASLLIEK